MDLKSLLEKNKRKVEKYSSYTTKVPSIATHDRPYIIDFPEDKKSVHDNSGTTPSTKTINNQNQIAKKGQTNSEQVTNGYQTGNKQVSINQSSSRKHNKTGNKRVTNGYQTGNKQVAINQRSDHNNEEIGNKQVSKQVTNERTNGYQTGNKQVSKQVTNPTINQTIKSNLSTLVGAQRNIILFFYFLSKKNAGQTTPPLTLEFISNSLEIKKGVVKMTIIRLQKKGLIFRSGGKTGRGGWTSYELSNVLYKDLMHQDNYGFLEDETGNKRVSNGYQTGNKQVSKQVSQQVTTGSSSSSYNIYKTTTTDPAREGRSKLLLEGWDAIDYSLLAEHGFSETHLLQLCERGLLEPQTAQDSIYYFAFDLKHNGKRASIKGDVINFFMGIVSKGRPYACPANYVSPQEEAMKIYLEVKEGERKRLEAFQQKIQEAEFSVWHSALSDEELQALLPSELTAAHSAHMPTHVKQTLKMKHLKTHFCEAVWPEVYRKLAAEQKTLV